MAIQLNDHFTFKKLFRAVIPSISMMMFISIYSVVDGLFVSNFVGTTAFASLNLIYSVIAIIGAIGFMIGAGGSALVAKTLGEGKKEEANQYFSMFIFLTLILGIIVSTIIFIFLPDIAVLLGAEDDMVGYCVTYGRICLGFQTCFIVQNTFQSFFVTAEKPQLGLYLSIVSGILNMILDALFIVAFDMGIAGAALATGLSQFVGAVVPFIYFKRNKNLIIQLVKPTFKIRPILKGCFNGISEFSTNISVAIVGMIYNFKLMSLAGENGVASYGAILYIQFIFLAIFFGYSMGVAPIVGFNYGAKNKNELKNILKKSIVVVLTTSVILVVLSEVLAEVLASIFVGYDQELLNMTTRGFRIFALSFLFAGFNIFISSFFTALNNGIVSLVLSLTRTFVFQVIAVLVLSSLLKIDGIWLSIICSELLAIFMSIAFVVIMRRKYEYY